MTRLVAVVSTLLLALASTPTDQGQGGDQFLDGIGETSLVARYVLTANAEDSSRNHFHAVLRGAGGTFVEDPQFRNVLLLTADGSHLQVPAEALSGEDTISVTGWLYLPTGASGPFFDFGKDAVRSAVRRREPRGLPRVGCSRRRDSPRRNRTQGARREPVDAPRRGLRPGAPRGDNVCGWREGGRGDGRCDECHAPTRLFVGRSQDDADADASRAGCGTCGSTALRSPSEQVATIRTNALSGRQSTRGRGAPPPEISTAAIPRESPLASRYRTSPTSPWKRSSARCRGCRSTVHGRVPRQRQGAGRAGDLAVADRQHARWRSQAPTPSPEGCPAPRSSRRRR